MYMLRAGAYHIPPLLFGEGVQWMESKGEGPRVDEGGNVLGE